MVREGKYLEKRKMKRGYFVYLRGRSWRREEERGNNNSIKELVHVKGLFYGFSALEISRFNLEMPPLDLDWTVGIDW